MKSVQLNYTDSGVTGVTSLSVSIPVLNYGKDFSIRENTANQAVITNITSPLAYPERFIFQSHDIADIYAGAGVDRSMMAPSKRGTKIFVQLNDLYKETDSVDATYEVALPMSCSITVKIPNSASLTDAQILAFVQRAVAGLFSTGVVDNTRIISLLRRSLIPADM